jgi:hypothetical protein
MKTFYIKIKQKPKKDKIKKKEKMCLNDPWPTHESLDAGSDSVRCGRQ